MPLAYSKDPDIQNSLRHSVKDGVATSVMTGGGESYVSAFAIYFKATTAELAILSSLPPLVGSLAQLLSAILGRRLARRRTLILTGAGMQTLSWLPFVALPLLFADQALGIMLLCLVLYHAAGNLAAPQWASLMGDLVPPRWRGRYFGRRTRIASATSFTALVIAGLVLDSLSQTQAIGFVIIFGGAAVARAIAVYHLARMHDPPPGPCNHAPASPPLLTELRGSHFVRFSLFHALMQFSVAIAGPFFIVYMLRDLQFTYTEFMANTAAAVLVQFLTLDVWGRISDAFGNRIVLMVTGFLIPVLPALWLVSENFWYLLVLQLLSGALWGGYNLSAGNYLYDVVPTERRTALLAYHNLFTSAGIFAGALLGGYLGAMLPSSVHLGGFELYSSANTLGMVFLISAVTRLAVSVLCLPRLKEGRTVRKMTARNVVLRLTRSRRLVRAIGLSRCRMGPLAPLVPESTAV